MSEHQARLERDLYDHEHDEPRLSGARRRRPVADWGVGDDVFEQMPRRRFARGVETPSRERRRTIVIDRPEDIPSEIAAVTADRNIEDVPPVAVERSAAPATSEPAPGERRTVRIGGRPEGSLEATRAQRHRPARTAHERVGHRPDRLAAWAVVLGMLLILIALLTAL